MEWHILLAAVASSTSMHRVMEPKNILYKLQRLQKAKESGKVEVPQMKGVDTRAKAISLSVVILIVTSLVFYLIFNVVNPSTSWSITYSVVILVIADVLSSVMIDKYHAAIEPITQSFATKK